MIFIKRTFDILFSSIILILLFPLIVLIIVMIKIISPTGSILFKQQRVGINGKLFTIYKFRTMINNAEIHLEEIFQKNNILEKEYKKHSKLENDPRILKYIGLFLRQYSLDEIPQFINIIKGDMTIVGPRPFLENEILKFKNELHKLNSIKPGITGLWQVSGRNKLSIEQRVKLDIIYIDNKSLWLDTKIVFKTIFVVVKKDGAY